MDNESKEINRTSKVSIIGPFISLLAAIITVFANLPPALRYTMVFLIAAISIYIVFEKQIIKCCKKIRMEIEHHSLAKKYQREFNMFVDRLQDLLNNNFSYNIPYVLNNLHEMPPGFNYPISLLYNLSNFLPVFKKEIKGLQKRHFRFLIEMVDLFLSIYNNQLVLQPLKQIQNIHKDKLTERDIEAYEKSRENYVRFLQDYECFSKVMNKDSGEKIAQEHFDKPGKL